MWWSWGTLYQMVHILVNTFKISLRIHRHTWVGRERNFAYDGLSASVDRDNNTLKFELLLFSWGHLYPQAGEKGAFKLESSSSMASKAISVLLLIVYTWLRAGSLTSLLSPYILLLLSSKSCMPLSHVLEVGQTCSKIVYLICLQFLQFINHRAQPFLRLCLLLPCYLIHMVYRDNLWVIYVLPDLALGVWSDPQGSGVCTMCVGGKKW